MKTNLINAAILASGVLVSSLASANTIAVKNGTIFLLGANHLSAQMISGAALSSACTTQLASQTINSAATDIVISGNNAVVAPAVVAGTADVVNISACLSGTDNRESRADLTHGTLEIPCLKVDGTTYYNVKMGQRGSSMNWEVEFGQPVTDGTCVSVTQ